MTTSLDVLLMSVSLGFTLGLFIAVVISAIDDII